MSQPKVVVCGEAYSQNLGDGLISEAVVSLVGRVVPAAEVIVLDISGRTGFSATKPKTKPAIAARLSRALMNSSRLYRRLWNQAAWRLFEEGRLRTAWADQLNGADLAIIGGGQLLQDNALSFPLRVRQLVEVAARNDVSIAFFACGVGSNWSRRATRLFRQALSDPHVVQISVRDEQSRGRLLAVLPELEGTVEFVPDPAIHADSSRDDRSARLIGLGITAPSALKRNLRRSGSFSRARLLSYWRDLATLICRQGFEVLLFTNGASTDQSFAEVVYRSMGGNNRVHLAPRPTRPSELVSTISSCKVIVAHRLHACIAAFSNGVPFVALEWDDKVRQFTLLTGCQDWSLGPDESTPESTWAKIQGVGGQKGLAGRRRQLSSKTEAAMRGLLAGTVEFH